jgi:putative addiction module component (TIGR02574 family)
LILNQRKAKLPTRYYWDLIIFKDLKLFHIKSRRTMMLDLKDIIDKAMALPPSSRANLAEILLESLDFEEDFPVNEEWLDEIKRRCREIDEGKVGLLAGKEALDKLDKQLT